MHTRTYAYICTHFRFFSILPFDCARFCARLQLLHTLPIYHHRYHHHVIFTHRYRHRITTSPFAFLCSIIWILVDLLSFSNVYGLSLIFTCNVRCEMRSFMMLKKFAQSYWGCQKFFSLLCTPWTFYHFRFELLYLYRHLANILQNRNFFPVHSPLNLATGRRHLEEKTLSSVLNTCIDVRTCYVFYNNLYSIFFSDFLSVFF